MTKAIRYCAWCGGAIPEGTRTGRPRRYCRRSHRQRAFEARRAGVDRGLKPGEVIVDVAELRAWRDARYLLESVLEDGAQDLADEPGVAETRAAYDQLATAAREVIAVEVSTLATGEERRGVG